MRRCEAEAPFDDDVIFCRLAAGHFSRWHEGLTDSRCPECDRRDCHTDACSIPVDNEVRVERVRWEGPNTPMPELTGLDRIVADRWLQMVEEARAKQLVDGFGRPIVKLDKAEVVAVQMLYGPPDGFDRFLAEAEEWGRELKRAPLTTAGLPPVHSGD